MNRHMLIGCALYLAFALALAGAARGQEWESGPDMPSPRFDMASAVLGSRIYVIGGRDRTGSTLRVLSSVMVYDTGSQAWSEGPELPEEVYDAAAAVLDGKIYVIGGAGEDDEASAEVYVFDADENRWKEGADLETERRGHQAAVLDGKIYVAGGVREKRKLVREVEVFDPEEDEWEEVDSWHLEHPRVSFAMAVLEDDIHVFGGLGGSVFEPLQAVEVLEKGRGPRIVPPGRFKARGYLASAVSGNTAYLLGGSSAQGSLSDVTAFTPSLGDPWRDTQPMQTARTRFAAAVVDGHLYAIGGVRDRGQNQVPLASIESMQVATSAGAPGELPTRSIRLEQNRPNPFAAATTVAFSVPDGSSTRITVEIFDILGRSIRTLVDERLVPGEYTVEWDGTGEGGRALGSGHYLCVLTTDGIRETRIMTRIR